VIYFVSAAYESTEYFIDFGSSLGYLSAVQSDPVRPSPTPLDWTGAPAKLCYLRYAACRHSRVHLCRINVHPMEKLLLRVPKDTWASQLLDPRLRPRQAVA
jgi:hypothetical protein